jgi:hypothetical protein
MLAEMDDYWKKANMFNLPLQDKQSLIPPTARPTIPPSMPPQTMPVPPNLGVPPPNMGVPPLNMGVPQTMPPKSYTTPYGGGLTLLGLPTGRTPHMLMGEGGLRDLDVSFEQTVDAELLRHKSYQVHELGKWPQTDLIIEGDLLFILIDAAGFDLASYYFEESAPNVLRMIGRKTALATFPELKNAPPELWKIRQRPLGDHFEFNINLNELNFRLDPATLTYANYNGCMVYRGLREPARPLQIFRYK